MNNNYLPINKFFARSEEMGETPITKNICDKILEDFIEKCYYESYNPYVSIWGISRRLSGKEINNLLIEIDTVVYSYYNKDNRKREYSTAYSLTSYDNLRPDATYQLEINTNNGSFIIYRID